MLIRRKIRGALLVEGLPPLLLASVVSLDVVDFVLSQIGSIGHLPRMQG